MTGRLNGDDRRDRAIERLLERQGRTGAGDAPSGVSSVCLDPEMLAAWHEGALSSDERRAVEAHLAGCTRCQAMLATFITVTPDAQAAPRRAWWRMPMTWLVPIATVATAIIVWIALPPRRESAAPPSVSAVARNEPASPVASAGRGTPPPTTNAQPETFADRRDARPRENAKSRDEARSNEIRDKKEADVAAAKPDVGAAAGGAGAPPPTLPTAPPPPAPAAAPTVAPQQAQAPTSQQQAQAPASQQQAPSQQQQQAAPPERTAARAKAAPTAPVDALSETVVTKGGLEKSIGARTIVSPDPRVAWSLVPGGAPGTIMATRDGGATWTRQQVTTEGVTLTDAAAPQRDICWVVGRQGAVFLTTDARTWRRLSFPESVDLTAVSAQDARTATVTTADGRQLVTRDGGATWR